MLFESNMPHDCKNEIIKIKEKAARAVSNISHDLKSPMVAITGFTSLLKSEFIESGANPQWMLYLDRIERAAASSLAMIEDILTLAKIEAGKEPVDMAWVYDLEEELLDVIGTFRMEAEARKTKIALEAKNLPPVLWDMRRIRYHVINNIISNALKFAPANGRINVWAQAVGGVVSIVIEDDGPGVPHAEREKIFHRFEQADLQTGRVFKGAGLGLANAALFVKRHGGKISVEDAQPHGARFTIELPCVPATGAPMEPGAKAVNRES